MTDNCTYMDVKSKLTIRGEKIREQKSILKSEIDEGRSFDYGTLEKLEELESIINKMNSEITHEMNRNNAELTDKISSELAKKAQKIWLLDPKDIKFYKTEDTNIHSKKDGTNAKRTNSLIDKININKDKKNPVTKEEAFQNIKMSKSDNSQFEIEHLKFQEEMRLIAFKSIRRAYKASEKHKWSRFVRKISGKSPKWKKIKDYSQEELDYLLATLQGETYAQDYRGNDFGRGSNWKEFADIINNKRKIDKEINIEKIEGRQR